MTRSSDQRNPVEMPAEQFLERKRHGENPTCGSTSSVISSWRMKFASCSPQFYWPGTWAMMLWIEAGCYVANRGPMRPRIVVSRWWESAPGRIRTYNLRIRSPLAVQR
jgi:hypothetical protein